MGLYEDLKAIEPFSLALHHDADGVYSAALLKRIFQVKEIQIPDFGMYTTEVSVDLGFPENKEWAGISIDHHPDHPEDRKYKLYWDYCPTGLVLYKHLKDHIKPKDYWLVVGSLTGDGQPDLTPDEIWEACPNLLSGRGVMYKSQWKLGISNTPLYRILSSGINSLCRYGLPEDALDVLETMETPEQMLENTQVVDTMAKMQKEEEAIYKAKCVAETIGPFVLVRIKTSTPEIGIHGLIASKLSGADYTGTFIVLNETNGKGSIRGDLAKYLANRLLAKGFKAGGHSKFCGVRTELENVENLCEAIRTIGRAV